MSSDLSGPRELQILSSPTLSYVDLELVSPVQSPIAVTGEIETAAKDPIVIFPVVSKSGVQRVDKPRSSPLIENMEKIPEHGPEHRHSLQTHERFYFKDGNVSFMVCTSIILITGTRL